jgi:hypothetical protein
MGVTKKKGREAKHKINILTFIQNKKVIYIVQSREKVRVFVHNFSLLHVTLPSPPLLSASSLESRQKDRSKKAAPVTPLPLQWQLLKHLSSHGVGFLRPTHFEWLRRKINAGKLGSF